MVTNNYVSEDKKKKIWEKKWWATCRPWGGVTLPAFLTGPPFVAEGNGFDKRIEGNLALCAKVVNKAFVSESTASQQNATVALHSKSGCRGQEESKHDWQDDLVYHVMFCALIKH